MSKTPRERFQDLLESFTTAMLVTRDADETLRGRPMQLAAIESDADLWFVTRTTSDKMAELEVHPQVGVVLQDSGRHLSLSGKASVVRDETKIAELWNESWRVWFPEGQDDPELALLHVDASAGEYWDNSGLRRLSYAIRAKQAYWTSETPEVLKEMNAKVSLP